MQFAIIWHYGIYKGKIDPVSRYLGTENLHTNLTFFLYYTQQYQL